MAARVDSSNPIAERVKHHRKKLGFTQEDLAVVAGLDISNISRIERGSVIPNTITIMKLSQALEITPNDLLLDSNDLPLLLDEEIVTQSSGLSSAEKAKVLEYISFLRYLSRS